MFSYYCVRTWTKWIISKIFIICFSFWYIKRIKSDIFASHNKYPGMVCQPRHRWQRNDNNDDRVCLTSFRVDRKILHIRDKRERSYREIFSFRYFCCCLLLQNGKTDIRDLKCASFLEFWSFLFYFISSIIIIRRHRETHVVRWN